MADRDDDAFDAAELLAVLDATEATGAPPHLVERLRELVRDRARPALFGTPDEVVVRRVPFPDYDRSHVRYIHRAGIDEYRAVIRWRNDDEIDCRVTAIAESRDAAGRPSVRYTGEVGGVRIEFPGPQQWEYPR